MEKSDNSDSTSLGLNSAINKALHIMAAHLHRYSSELERVENIVLDLLSRHEKSMSFIEMFNDGKNGTSVHEWNRVKLGFEQIMSQLKAVRAFLERISKARSKISSLW